MSIGPSVTPFSAIARCFVTRDLPGPALDRLRAEHEVELWTERMPPPRAELERGAATAEGLLCLLTDPIDAELIAGCPELRAIANCAVGTDNVEIAAATARGIPVGNTPEVLTDSTADLAVALMLAISRRLCEGERAVHAGEWLTWEPAWLLGRDLNRAAVGNRRRRADRPRGGRAPRRASAAGSRTPAATIDARSKRCSPSRTSSPCIAR